MCRSSYTLFQSETTVHMHFKANADLVLWLAMITLRGTSCSFSLWRTRPTDELGSVPMGSSDPGFVVSSTLVPWWALPWPWFRGQLLPYYSELCPVSLVSSDPGSMCLDPVSPMSSGPLFLVNKLGCVVYSDSNLLGWTPCWTLALFPWEVPNLIS